MAKTTTKKEAKKKTKAEESSKKTAKKTDKKQEEGVETEVVEQKKPDTEKPEVDESSEGKPSESSDETITETEDTKKDPLAEEENKVKPPEENSGLQTEDQAVDSNEAEKDNDAKDEASDETEDEVQKPRRFNLPFVHKGRKKNEGKNKEEKEVKEPPISAQEAINQLDEKNKIKEQVMIEKVAEEIDEAVEEMEHAHEYWVIKIRKKLLLVVVGVAVLTMWLIPLSRGAIVYFEDDISSALDKVEGMIKKEPSEEINNAEDNTQEEASESAGLKIRVRAGSADQEGANSVVEMLQLVDNVDYVELVDEGETNFDAVEIVTAEEGDETYRLLYNLLDDSYQMASNGATLDESDIDAVVRFGE